MFEKLKALFEMTTTQNKINPNLPKFAALFTSQEPVRLELFFTGRVQGVGFRYNSMVEAKELGLTGWVQNLDDGRVQMEVQGPSLKIDQLINQMQQKPLVEIKHITYHQQALKAEPNFKMAN